MEQSKQTGIGSTQGSGMYSAANRLRFEYATEAEALGKPTVPIIDSHTHIHGEQAAKVWADVADRFGVEQVYTMTRLSHAQRVADVLGPRVRFIAFPDWTDPDRESVHRNGYMKVIETYREKFGARMVKFWSGPALRDYAQGDPEDLVALDSPWRVRQAELATELGMALMVHIADPDTWFATRYADQSIYGTKASQYESFERMLERFTQPWIAAHMGGWPENLDFLSGLLERHSNLYLDTSATKWMVRTLSAQPRAQAVEFFTRWQERLLFGSDIVTMDEHLQPDTDAGVTGKSNQASSATEAFDLYASRYWALRVMLETNYEGESPIVDPDLAMTEPDRYDETAAPTLRGMGLPVQVLENLYRNTAMTVVEKWCESHP